MSSFTFGDWANYILHTGIVNCIGNIRCILIKHCPLRTLYQSKLRTLYGYNAAVEEDGPNVGQPVSRCAMSLLPLAPGSAYLGVSALQLLQSGTRTNVYLGLDAQEVRKLIYRPFRCSYLFNLLHHWALNWKILTILRASESKIQFPLLDQGIRLFAIVDAVTQPKAQSTCEKYGGSLACPRNRRIQVHKFTNLWGSQLLNQERICLFAVHQINYFNLNCQLYLCI